LARRAVENFATTGKIIDPHRRFGFAVVRAAASVSIKTRDGELRLHRTIDPVKHWPKNILNAISSATCDPRFSPGARRRMAD
jgi:AMMECR1 domain-containing protein